MKYFNGMTVLCCHQNNSVHSVVLYVVFWSCVLCYQCCLLLSVELLMCFMIMHRLMQLGFGRHALLEIPLTAPTFFFSFIFYLNHAVCFISHLLFPTFPPSLFPVHQEFRILNCLRPQIFFFTAFYHPFDLTRMSACFYFLVMLLSTGLPLRHMFPNLPVPNPYVFYNYWNFLSWISHEVFMDLMYWSFNLMLQNDAFSSLCG